MKLIPATPARATAILTRRAVKMRLPPNVPAATLSSTARKIGSTIDQTIIAAIPTMTMAIAVALAIQKALQNFGYLLPARREPNARRQKEQKDDQAVVHVLPRLRAPLLPFGLRKKEEAP
jgi:hypothetical protein